MLPGGCLRHRNTDLKQDATAVTKAHLCTRQESVTPRAKKDGYWNQSKCISFTACVYSRGFEFMLFGCSLFRDPALGTMPLKDGFCRK
jgi:hypothetical protein